MVVRTDYDRAALLPATRSSQSRSKTAEEAEACWTTEILKL